jgi:hypothetical protein
MAAPGRALAETWRRVSLAETLAETRTQRPLTGELIGIVILQALTFRGRVSSSTSGARMVRKGETSTRVLLLAAIGCGLCWGQAASAGGASVEGCKIWHAAGDSEEESAVGGHPAGRAHAADVGRYRAGTRAKSRRMLLRPIYSSLPPRGVVGSAVLPSRTADAFLLSAVGSSGWCSG